MIKLLLIFVLLGSLILITVSVAASPIAQEVTLFLDTAGQNINALSGELIIPNNFILTAINDGNSVIKFWLEKPQLIDQRLIFSGIIPGGYTGDNVELFKFSISGETIRPSDLKFANLEILLNDGLGTKAKILPDSIQISIERLAEESVKVLDSIPPEKFKPIISSDPAIFAGQFFVVFATQDKQSGLDHYEVAESRWLFPKLVGLNWAKSESPHLLLDQTERVNLYIKAVDRAGNERVASLIRYHWYQSWLFWIIITSLICFLTWGLRKLFSH